MAKIRWVDGELCVYSRWWVTFNPKAEHLSSKEENIEWFWRTNPSRVHGSLDFLKGHLKENGFHNILSFGSGLCTLEYLLWEYLSKHCSKDVFLVASDVDKRVVDVASRLFPEIHCMEFDFYWHSFELNIKFKFDVDFDFAFTIDSTYSMDDDTFVSFFKELREGGVSNVVDFCGGIVRHKRYPGEFLYRLYNGLGYVLNGTLSSPECYIPVDSPHGFGRTRRDLIRLYNHAGYDVVDEPVVDGVRYVAVLKG